MAKQSMAFDYKENKRGEVILTKPENITFDEEKNGRAFLYQKEDFQDLLEDLQSNIPIRTPIWAYKISKEGKEVDGLQLVAGHRRLLAALEFSKDHPESLIKVLIVDPPKDAMEFLEMNIEENSGHKGLTIIDQGHNAIMLREEPTRTGGRTLEQIAKRMRISQPQVTQAIKIVEGLPEVLQRAIAKGTVTADAGLTVLKVEDPEKRAGLIEQLLAGKFTKEPKVVVIPPAGSRVDLSSNEPVGIETPKEPTGQAERPMPKGTEDKEPKEDKKANLRDAVRDAGGKVALRLPELKKYLQEAIDEEGPGSNLGEVKLKKAMLKFLAGEIKPRTMDDNFNKFCKMKGD